MWFKYPILFVLFYFFAILQNSFFVHFAFFGAIPNIVFILFLLLVFFEKRNIYASVAIYAIFAGLFLDLFSSPRFAISSVILLVIGFMVKKIQLQLREKEGDKFPLVYFLPIFFVSLLTFNIFSGILSGLIFKFNYGIIAELAYNLLGALIGFYTYKTFLKKHR
jgi:rod shape-determining protein MreD